LTAVNMFCNLCAMVTRTHAKHNLRAQGWSMRRAADELGVTHVHLAYVLSGARESRRLIEAAAALGRSPVPYRRTGFARRVA
jgi:transcriptional regulator with XRE-family HTH domain